MIQMETLFMCCPNFNPGNPFQQNFERNYRFLGHSCCGGHPYSRTCNSNRNKVQIARVKDAQQLHCTGHVLHKMKSEVAGYLPDWLGLIVYLSQYTWTEEC